MVAPASLLHALCLLVGAQAKLRGDDGSAAITAPDCRVASQNPKCGPLPSRGREAPNDDDDSEHAPSARASLRGRPPQLPDEYEWEDGAIYIRAGTLVSLYGDKSPFAAPAYVTGHSREPGSSSVKYRLLNAITNEEFDAGGEFVHPYQVYEDGTEAHCNVGSLRTLYLTPCTVKSHSVEGSGDRYSYRVSYLDRSSNKQVQAQLPLSRVQRVLPPLGASKMVA